MNTTFIITLDGGDLSTSASPLKALIEVRAVARAATGARRRKASIPVEKTQPDPDGRRKSIINHGKNGTRKKNRDVC